MGLRSAYTAVIAPLPTFAYVNKLTAVSEDTDDYTHVQSQSAGPNEGHNLSDVDTVNTEVQATGSQFRSYYLPNGYILNRRNH